MPFSMDKVIFNHPRRGRVARQPEKGSSSSSTAVRTRSTYGNLRDMARNYVRSFKKRGFKDLVDRLVRDPFFQFNAANQNLVPEALLFIERLAGCVSPTIERTKAQVLGEKLEMATKLIFVPSSEREPDQPLDLHTARCLCHIGASFSTLANSQSMWQSSSSRSKDPYPLFMAGATVTSCQMLLTQKGLRRNWWSSASCNGRTMPPNRRTKSLKPQATTGRSVYPMRLDPLVDLNMNDLTTSSSSQTLESLLAVVLTVKARVEKVTTKAEDRQRERDSRRERASKAEAHREVWPIVTMKEIPTGFRAIAIRGTGTNSVAGTGAGPELLDDSH